MIPIKKRLLLTSALALFGIVNAKSLRTEGFDSAGNDVSTSKTIYQKVAEEWNNAWSGNQPDGPHPVFAKLIYPKSMDRWSQEQRKRRMATEETDEHGDGHDDEHDDEHDDGHDENEAHESHISYDDKYNSLVFLMAIFFSGKIFEMVGMPSLIGEIICGFLLGPPLANFAPQPSAWLLVGEIGLYLLMVEAGVEVDLAMLKLTGARALAIGLTGSGLPLIIGTGMGLGLGLDLKPAIALGCCFAPTSLAVASGALNAGNAYNTPVGQLIVSSCVIDDVIGLILLSVVNVLAAENPPVIDYIIPVLSSFGLLILLGGSAITWFPKFIEKYVLTCFPEKSRDIVAFGMMMGLVLGYIPALNFSKASDLTGAFLAGMAFSQVHSTHHVFVHQTKQVMKWMMRIFFASVIGFNVPITQLFAQHILKRGFIFYILVLTKLPVGFFTPHFQKVVPKGYPFNPFVRDVLITGVGMTCRGEMSFIIGSEALLLGIFDQDTYAAMVLGVLVSSITSPFFLLVVINIFNKLQDKYLDSHHPSKGKSEYPLYLVIQTRTDISWGLQHKIRQCVGSMGLIIIDHRHWHPRELNSVVASEIFVQDPTVHIPIHPNNENEMEEVTEDHTEAFDRIREVKKSLFVEIGQEDAVIEVQQWHPHAIEESSHDGKSFADMTPEEQEEALAIEAEKMIDKHQTDTTSPDRFTKTSNRRSFTRKPKLASHRDLWVSDRHVQMASTRGRIGQARLDTVPETSINNGPPTIQDRLAGTVRSRKKST